MRKASFKDRLKKARFYIQIRNSKGIFKVICDGYYFEYKNVKIGINKGNVAGRYVATELSTGMSMEEYTRFPTKKQLEKIADYLLSKKNSIPYDRYTSKFSGADVLEESSLIQWTKDEIEIDLTSQTTKS